MSTKKIANKEITTSKEETNNGNYIPVKYSDAELWYDTKNKQYFAKVKVGMNKIVLVEEKK